MVKIFTANNKMRLSFVKSTPHEMRGQSFSTYAKFSEKITFLTPCTHTPWLGDTVVWNQSGVMVSSQSVMYCSKRYLSKGNKQVLLRVQFDNAWFLGNFVMFLFGDNFILPHFVISQSRELLCLCNGAFKTKRKKRKAN